MVTFNNYDFINESKILGSNPGFAGGGYSVLDGRKNNTQLNFLANANFKLTDNLTMNASIGEKVLVQNTSLQDNLLITVL